MRVQATCRHCGNDFYLHSLYNADWEDRDRCPRCGRHLGTIGVHRVARQIDDLGTQLTRALVRLAEDEPAMRIQPDEICAQVCAAAHQAANAGLSDLAARRAGLHRDATAERVPGDEEVTTDVRAA